MRLIISKDGESLDLKPGTSLGLDMNSPVWFGDRDPDIIPGLKAYTITVPPTPKNRRLLKRPAQLDNPQPLLSENGWEVYHDGRLIGGGTLMVEDAGIEADIRVAFIGGLAGNLSDFKDRYLSEFMAGEDFTVGTTTQHVYDYAGRVTLDPDSYDFLFPTINISEDSGYVESEEGGQQPVATRYAFLNLYDAARYALTSGIQYEISGIDQPVIIEYTSMAAQPRLHWVLKKLFERAGFSLTGVFDSDEHFDELRNLILLTNHTQDIRARFPAEEVAIADLELDPTFRPSQMMPKVKANEFLKQITNRFCWTPFIDERLSRIRMLPNRDLIKADNFVDWTKKVDPRYVINRTEQTIPRNFTTGFAGDDAFPEDFTYKVRPSDRVQVFETVDELFASPEPEQLLREDVYYVSELNEYFFFRARSANRRIYQSLGRDFGQTARGQEPGYSAGAGTVLTRTFATLGTNRWLSNNGIWWFPAWWTEPETPLTEAEITDEILLLFYRGLQPNRLGRNYPFATNGIHNIQSEVIGDLSLTWNGDRSLFDVWWKDWIDAIHRMKPVTYRIRLTSQDVADLDFARKVRIGQQLYFVKRVQVNLEERGIGMSTVDLMKIT